MTLYTAFEQLVSTHGVSILDFPVQCKAEFCKNGFSEGELDVRLFFLLLDKHVPLEARKLTYQKKNFTVYSLSVILYTNLFGAEKLSNEYENLLLRQINLIVDVLVKEEVITIERETKTYCQKYDDFSAALAYTIQHYGCDVLSKTEKLRTLLKDMLSQYFSHEIGVFLVFLEKLNCGQECFLDKDYLHYLRLLDGILEKMNLTYAPLIAEGIRYKAYLSDMQQAKLTETEPSNKKVSYQENKHITTEKSHEVVIKPQEQKIKKEKQIFPLSRNFRFLSMHKISDVIDSAAAQQIPINFLFVPFIFVAISVVNLAIAVPMTGCILLDAIVKVIVRFPLILVLTVLGTIAWILNKIFS